MTHRIERTVSDQEMEYALSRIDSMILFRKRSRRLRECDADDMRQDAIVAVLKNIGEYDALRSCKHTYLNRIILYALRKRTRPIMVRQEISKEYENSLIDLKMDLATLRLCITKKQQEVYDHMGTHSQIEIARLLNVSAATVHGRWKRIKHKASLILHAYFE